MSHHDNRAETGFCVPRERAESISNHQPDDDSQLVHLLISRLTVPISECGDSPGGKAMEGFSSLDVELYDSSGYGDIEGVIAALSQGGRVTVRHPKGHTSFVSCS